jgi:hypothetical protein
MAGCLTSSNNVCSIQLLGVRMAAQPVVGATDVMPDYPEQRAGTEGNS